MNLIIFTCVRAGGHFQRGIGAYQLAHFVRSQGYTVQVIDFTDDFTDEELVAATDKFLTEDTLAIGMSTTFYGEFKERFLPSDIKQTMVMPNFPSNIEAAVVHARQKHPSIKVIIGGAKSEAAKNIPGVDVVIHGYGEDKVVEYLNNLPNSKLKQRKTKFTLSTANDTLPLIIKDDPIDKKFDIEHLNHRFLEQDVIIHGESLPIEVSRGCIFRCKFCAFPLNGKSKLDYIRSAAALRDELIYNYEMFGVTNYFLSDDTFNDSTEKIVQLHKVITSLPFKIRFATYLRLDLLYAHKEQIQLLYEMGLCSPFFGIETMNKRSASTIGKAINPTRAKDFLLDLYYNHWKEEMAILCSFIVGLPHETEQTARETYNWISQTPLSTLHFALHIQTDTFFKSEFQMDWKKYGYTYDPETRHWSNEHMTYTRAVQLAEEFNAPMFAGDMYTASFNMLALMSHGYTYEDLRTKKIKDLNKVTYFKNRIKNIREYKQRLMSL